MAQPKEHTYICHYTDNGSYRTMEITLPDDRIAEWGQEFPNDRLELVKD